MGQLYTHLIQPLWKKENIRVLIIGLDNSGKTSLLYLMKLGDIVTTIPSIGFNVETVQHNNVQLTAWDVSGRSQSRPLLRHFLSEDIKAVIFVIDSNDVERLPEARDQLSWVLMEDAVWDAVVMVLANKQDIPGAVSVEKMKEALGFEQVTKNRSAAVFPVSITNKTGVKESLDWLCEQTTIKLREKYLSGYLVSKDTCNILQRIWSVRSLIETGVSSINHLLSGWSDKQNQMQEKI